MPEIDLNTVREVDQRLIERYSTRLAQFGNDARTLGWDKRESQFARFDAALNTIDLSGKTVLDVGCGLADFYDLVNERGIPLAAYSGCDINGDLLERCRDKYPQSSFFQANLLVDDVADAPYDVIVLFGVLNFRFRDFSNEDFARQMIQRAFANCSEAVVVDMLTAVRDENYPQEDFVYYYDPLSILEFAFSLTPHVILKHDYRSLPQREMLLVLRKSPCR